MCDRTFRPYEPEQPFLLPPTLQEWLPAEHLAYFISDLVEALDLTAILSWYDKPTRGTVPYHPQMLVKVLLYAYCVGTPSSRQIARKLDEDIAFRVLAANNTPDFRTIAEFRKRHLTALKGIFVQVLRLCRRAGLVKLGHVAVDGTKVKANASKHKAMSYERMQEEETRLQAEVDALLAHAEEVDVQEDATYGAESRGDELPQELAFRASRLEKIRAAKAMLEQEARDAAAATSEEREGPPMKSSPAAPAASPGPKPKAQKNFTDPDSRIMPSSSDKGSFVQGYNCQAAVDATAQIIVATEVTQETNDKRQAQPLLAQVIAHTTQVPTTVSLDAGYFSEANVQALKELGTETLIPPDRQTHRQARPHAPRGRIPKSLSVADRMRRTLRTKRGRARYAKRKVIVEPVFGQIKQGRGFRQFLLRGLQKVQGEWALICTTHNVRKLWAALMHSGRNVADFGKAWATG